MSLHGYFMGDSVIASAVLDRLLHHSHVLNIRGRDTGSGKNATRGSSGRIVCWELPWQRQLSLPRMTESSDQNQMDQS